MTNNTAKFREQFDALMNNPIFLADSNWQKRFDKAFKPLDVEKRVKSSLYTAATKELDTAAMKHHRRTGEHKAVTVADIDDLYDKKWAKHLEEKAEKEAKQKAFARAD